ncbi:polyribonucleotide nucleotidyltransferase, partial [Patescibacteria group bacterium]|nr:polyribonucleotide nucleotidyltransferase [Patescibacteria group bacterium]
MEFGGKPLTLTVGKVAKQATSAVMARLGDTMVLVTVVEGKERADLGYFPLTIEYVERLYAGGRIKGSRWVKREGRPSDDSILTARLIDRSIRPLFPKEYKKEVQIVITVLSVDGENEPDILSIVATSFALSISSIPWNGPIAAVRVGYVKEKDNGNEEYIMKLGRGEIELSELDMVLSQTKDKTVMIEAGASEVSEQVALSAIKKAHAETVKVIDFIEEAVKKIGKKKQLAEKDPLFLDLVSKIKKSYGSEIASLIPKSAVKESSSPEQEQIIDAIFETEKTSNPESEIDKKMVAKAFEKVFFGAIRENVILKGQRPDGRKIDEIRPISSEVSVLPRTHGSAIFQRGDTQALTVVTLGSPRMEQLIESPEGEESKRYIHHYSMPPYSVGETGRIGVPSRREIGHGALAERALVAVIPNQDKFPYTIRVVSEILSSNGSTSMASVCGSTLSLMDAGVPIKKPVAGLAMGLMSDGDKYVILTDIIGLEDFSWDMDFKVAGTDSGITAIQLDVKIPGLTIAQIEEILGRAKEGRLFILQKMLSVIPDTRSKLSEYAPKIEMIHIPVEKIGELIGPGGRVIKNIMARTGATIDVEDDGSVTVTGSDKESLDKTVTWIKGITREIGVGEEFVGEVKRILPFGAFVELTPGKEGMVHVSEMAQGFVKDPYDVVKIGDKVKVTVKEIDEQGRINLSMLSGEKKEIRQKQPSVSEHPLSMQFKR